MAYKPLTDAQKIEMEAEQQAFADELGLETLFPDEEEDEPAEEDFDDEKLEEEVRLNASRPTKEELRESMGPVQKIETNAYISASNCLRWQGAVL